MDGIVRNQVRFIFNEAGEVIGYKNPETGVDTPLPRFAEVDGVPYVFVGEQRFRLTRD